MSALAVNSGRDSVAGTKGLKAGLMGVDAAMWLESPVKKQCYMLRWECISGSGLSRGLALWHRRE
jgi:hypothetical protein